MSEFIKKIFSRDTTDYFRLTNLSVDEICNKKTIKITDEMLKNSTSLSRFQVCFRYSLYHI